MTAKEIADWMQNQLDIECCLYQEDVVDFLIKGGYEEFTIENADGNIALSRPVLSAFLALNRENVVWVKPDKYWRYRVSEDEPGREARG